MVVPLAEVGTDRHRDDMWTVKARDTYNAYRDGYDWGFKSFKKQDGYNAQTLEATWLRGPFLHNGSVPTVADLLNPVEQRPRSFLIRSTTVDPDRLGFKTAPCDPAVKPADGFCFDTTQPGNSNAGHTYGTDLPADDKQALLAYLASL